MSLINSLNLLNNVNLPLSSSGNSANASPWSSNQSGACDNIQPPGSQCAPPMGCGPNPMNCGQDPDAGLVSKIQHQAGRIEQGVESGQLSPQTGNALASNLEGIASQLQTERQADGGPLSPSQHHQIASELRGNGQEIS
ncbi:MAG: hypothetical protein ACREM8_02890, partial [Vulcanimicrobiaceae bacterium]